jgi:type III secretion system needle length determinant
MTSFNPFSSVGGSGGSERTNQGGGTEHTRRSENRGDLDQAANDFSSLMKQPSRREGNRKGDAAETEGQAGEGTGGTGESLLGEGLFDAVSRWGEGGGSGGSGDEQGTGDEHGQGMAGAMGDAILQALSGGKTEEPARTEAPPALNQMIDEIADRVLVSEPGTTDHAEVRIQIKDSILPGTEVRIAEVNGELQISLHTESQQSFDLLNRHVEVLQSRLEQRLDGRHVAVQLSQGAQSGSDHQGRSRQQRDIIEETKKS